MNPYMMNMCEMCMHRSYCTMMMGRQPMNMEQMPMMQHMDMDMSDADMMEDMDLMNYADMDENIMDYTRTEYTSDEANEDIAANADLITDETDDLEFARKHKDHWKHCDCDDVLRKIEKNNPEIFRALTMCGIPYCDAKRFISRVISLTIKYCER
ncbi:hypothetical protein [uncultured Clostridium sp.]|uniref:hypothetical protein n=1 Tax=uncultured Clostridium sp. TaxID=59620 RepID=UPI0028E974E9|nr:hypothetical protein [uncultured Clostridium sp.]